MTPEKRGAYHTNQYRNVFQEVGYDEALVMQRLQDTWEQLFYGDEDTYAKQGCPITDSPSLC